MSIGVIATIKIQDGKNDEFEAVFTELAAQVNELEEGCTLYQLNKSRNNVNTYVVMEQYVDQVALDAHSKTDYFRTLSAKLAGCLAAAPTLDIVDAV